MNQSLPDRGAEPGALGFRSHREFVQVGNAIHSFHHDGHCPVGLATENRLQRQFVKVAGLQFTFEALLQQRRGFFAEIRTETGTFLDFFTDPDQGACSTVCEKLPGQVLHRGDGDRCAFGQTGKQLADLLELELHT